VKRLIQVSAVIAIDIAASNINFTKKNTSFTKFIKDHVSRKKIVFLLY